MIKKSKGQMFAVVGEFAFSIFVILLVVIFIVNFKVHITQAMVDHYLWSKENDIPMTLFSIDIDRNSNPQKMEYESSAIFLSRLNYADVLGEDKDTLKNQLNPILDKWSRGVLQYNATFGDFIFNQENGCSCKINELAPVRAPELGITYGTCVNCEASGTNGEKCIASQWGRYSGRVADKPYTCLGYTTVTNLGVYPLPIVYNGTQRILTLNFQLVS
jgi:hypothetical protein